MRRTGIQVEGERYRVKEKKGEEEREERRGERERKGEENMYITSRYAGKG